MKPRTTALLLVLALFAVAAPAANADDGKAAIDEYAESLPAGEGKVHPALSGSKPKPKDSGSTGMPSPGAGSTSAQPQDQAPAASGAGDRSGKGDKSDKSKKGKSEKDKAKDDEDGAAAAGGAGPGDKDKAILDRLESDPALGAPPAPTAQTQNAAATSDDGDSMLSSVFDPGGALLWLLLGMVGLVVFGAVRLSRSRGFETGPDPTAS